MIKLMQISSLGNIMPKYSQEFTPISRLCVLKGERASYQLAYCMDNSEEYNITIESEIKEHLKIYKVGCVPVVRAIFNYKTINDDNYISTEGGMYPDILYPFSGNTIRGEYYYQGIWIETNGKIEAGKYNIRVTISNERESVSQSLTLEVLNVELPKQKLRYSIAVHADCIANFYNMEVFSEEHWLMLEKFIKISAEYGSDMLTPPLFTPPVDTKVGSERLTVQLIEIYKDEDKYSFDFSKLDRFIDICRNAGINSFFMPQFFTQWGAEFTPKIIVNENGVKKRMFGWDVKSTDERYLNFLRQFVPRLHNYIKEQGLENNVIFSISDEPFDDETVVRYKKLNEFLSPYLKDYKVLDAFQNYKHYKDSGAMIPLIPTNAIKDFEGKVTNLHVYYCCAQDYKVSNRLIAMPSYRNRCFGYQLYKYDVKGFFHWALNFYNSQLSVRPINPFYETDADGGFPAGDPYSVYPAENGPIPSLRLVVFNEALQDLRVLELLENYIGRDAVIKLIENITGEITFESCAKNASVILELREKIMSEIKEHIN